MTAGAPHSITIAGTRLELSSADATELEVDAHFDLPGGDAGVPAGEERACERELVLGDAVRAALARAELGGAASVALAVAAHDRFALAVEQSADVIVGTIRAFLAPGSKLQLVVLRAEDGVVLEAFAGELDRHRSDIEQ